MEKNFIDKELLLKDLSARLPYGVICNTLEGDGRLCSIIQTIFGIEYGINIKATEREYFNDYFNDKEICIKPYLRPMSSMILDELIEFNNIPSTRNYQIGKGDLHWDVANYKQINWLLKNNFDFMCLIEKGLAIEVTEENNPYKD